MCLFTGDAKRSEPHRMLIWRDKKRGTKVFKVDFGKKRVVSITVTVTEALVLRPY